MPEVECNTENIVSVNNRFNALCVPSIPFSKQQLYILLKYEIETQYCFE